MKAEPEVAAERRGEGRRAKPAVRSGERDETVPFSNIRKRTAEHMVRSQDTSAHTLVVIEVDYADVEKVRDAVKDKFKADEGFGLSYLPFIARALVDAIAEFPRVNASVGNDELIVHHVRQPRHRRRPQLRGPHRPGRPRRRHQAAAGPRPRDRRPRRPGPGQEARRRRHQRRHVHDHQPGRVRHAAHRPDHQPAPGGDPLHRRREAQARRRRAARRHAGASPCTRVGNLALAFDHRAYDGAYASAFLASSRRSSRRATGRTEL